MTLTVSSCLPQNTASADKYSLLRNREHSSELELFDDKKVSGDIGRNAIEKDSFKNSKIEKRDGYSDPLLKWPLRGLAFTNDIGAAVMDIAPNLGLVLWIPALMYFGADIYDKYKTDEKEYSPSGKRAFKQAVFQACASVALPIAVVHAGQKAASKIAENYSKDGLSLQLKEEVDQFTINMLKRRKLKDYESNPLKFKSEFNEHIKLHLIDMENSRKTKNPLKILGRWIFGSKHDEKIDDKKFKKVIDYADKNIDDIFEIRKDLLADKKPAKISDKLLKLFDSTKRSFAIDKNSIETPVEGAIKATLKQVQRDKLFKTKLLKTVGGFASLAVSIKFIDKFVENIIIDKVVEPGLDNIEARREQIQFGKIKLKNNA